MQKFIQAAKQRAKLFSENCNLQNFSGFDVMAILFSRVFFSVGWLVDVDLVVFFFVNGKSVMRFGVCVNIRRIKIQLRGYICSADKKKYRKKYETTECKFIGRVFWD